MRLSTLSGFLILASLNLLAAGFTSGQSVLEKKVGLSVNHQTLDDALQLLQRQTGYSIFYPSKLVAPYQDVSSGQSKATVSQFLDQVLQKTGLGFKQNGNTIIIFEKTAASAANSQVPPKRVTGKVTDEQGEPLPGVTIRVKNNNSVAAITNSGGEFTLDAPNENDVLVFSFIGFASQEISIRNTSALRVVLKAASGALNEVQVIGYGQTSRRLNTGAVSSITSSEISKQPVDNPLTALQGRLAGVQITQDNGLPGSGVRVQIRGNNSLSSGTLPLYVVDGVPFTLFNGGSPASDNLNAYGISGANGSVSPFSLINPSDIERVDVLKDADATAIYGSRGANGVILITTKKGQAGNTRFNVNFYKGIGKVNHFIDMLNTPEYLAMRRQAFASSGVVPTANNAPDLNVWDQNAYTDWQRWAIGGTSHITNANASVSGGNEQNTFLFSSTYRKEGTVFPGDFGASTFSNRLNAGHKSRNNRFAIDLSVSYNYSNSDLIGSDISSLYSLAPNYPLYNPNGTLNWVSTNPLSYLLKSYDNNSSNLVTNLNLKYSILPGLDFRANLGYSLTSLKQNLTNPASSQNPGGATVSSLRFADNDNANYIIEPQLNYTRKLGKGKLDALLGTTFQNTIADGNSLTGTGYSNEALINRLAGASAVTVSASNYSKYRYTAVFGRLNYNWEDKYIVDGTFRRDGSSRFGPNNRFGNFGAVGAAWIFTNESFLRELSWLSFGKLRGSWGVTGNDQIQNYLYRDLYNVAVTAYAYQGSPVITPGGIGNPDLKWETTKKIDLALELGFLKDRLLLKANYFRNRSSNQLVSLALPTQIGVNSYTSNAPVTIQNKGFEFELSTNNIELKDFKWATAFNITFVKNKLLSIEDASQLFNPGNYIVGQPVNGLQLYQYTGINPQNGIPTYRDLNNDGAITFAGDRAIAPIGNPFYGGFNNTFNYKNFQLDIFFRFEHRNAYLNNSFALPLGSSLTNVNVAALNRWQTPGDQTNVPKANSLFVADIANWGSSTANWGDASFIKLKTVNLSYTIPNSLVNRFHLSNVSVYAQGQNLFTWAKQKYTLDPETTVPGTGSGLGTGQFIAMPQLRTIVLGINCSF